MPKKKVEMPALLGCIYARYSSHAQREESIEQQVAECKAYAESNGIKIVAIYADHAISGRSDKRPEFQKMMRLAEKRQFQIVVAYKSNRISRNMLHALAYEDKLARFGIRLVYAKEEFGDTAAGRFALRTMMNVNQFYSENMAEDITRGMMDNAQQCKINGVLPLGYKRGEDNRYAIDELTAPIVQEIFERVSNGDTCAAIANDLNARGLTTSTGARWSKSSFHSILKNERYIGTYIYSTTKIPNGIPPIIEKELFQKVQNLQKIKNNVRGRHQPTGDYLLTGKLYCGHCQSHMVGVSGTSKSGAVHNYYACQRRRTEKTCDKRSVRRDWVEREVAMALQEIIMHNDVIEWIADTVIAYQKKHLRDSQLANLEKKLNGVKKSIANIMMAIEQGIFTDTTRDRLLELEGEQRDLSTLIAAEKAMIPDTDRERIIYYLEQFQHGDIDDKKYLATLFDSFLVAAYLYDDHFRIVFNYAGKCRTTERPFDPNTILSADSTTAECSYNLSFGPPEKSQANTDDIILMVKDVFVLVFYFKHA